MKLIRSLLFLLSTMLLGACSISTTKIITIDETTPCNSIYARVGQELIISLSANPSTGYNWVVSLQPDFLSIIEANKIIYPQNHTTLIGAPGISIWHYKVGKSGSGILKLYYQRGWSKDTLVARMFSCQIIVN